LGRGEGVRGTEEVKRRWADFVVKLRSLKESKEPILDGEKGQFSKFMI
jgi:hypothetical protein